MEILMGLLLVVINSNTIKLRKSTEAPAFLRATQGLYPEGEIIFFGAPALKLYIFKFVIGVFALELCILL